MLILAAQEKWGKSTEIYSDIELPGAGAQKKGSPPPKTSSEWEHKAKKLRKQLYPIAGSRRYGVVGRADINHKSRMKRAL